MTDNFCLLSTSFHIIRISPRYRNAAVDDDYDSFDDDFDDDENYNDADERANRSINPSMPSTAHYIEIRSVPQHREAKMKIRKSCCKTELQSS